MSSYRTSEGKIITVLEKLIEWESHAIFYKIQWEDNIVNIISEKEFRRLIIDNQLTITEPEKLTTQDKFKLFYQYFRGRQDVYAIQWKNLKGKTGYSPHAKGEWIQETIGQHVKNKFVVEAYYPYTLETVENHIRGTLKDFQLGTGIYPMLPDDRTYLVVMDFDDETAKETVEPVLRVCENYQVIPLIELSQSGKGIHLWFFFEDAIPARLARHFANLLLRHAMSKNTQLDFSSFDRIIPMQDTLPSKGFGNIIALPLRTQKVLDGKTIFLDKYFKPVANMWQKLAQTPQYNKQNIEEFIEKLEQALPIQLFNNKTAIDNPNPMIKRQLTVLSRGELLIDKQQLTRKELIQLAHLATFRNPDFYKRQQMRMGTWETPQYITGAREDETYLYLPRGLKTRLDDCVEKINILEEYSYGRPISVSFSGQLSPEQEKAKQAMMSHTMGIISARTGFGKTVLAASIIAEKKVSCLIIVHNRLLADQWEQRLTDFLTIQTEPVVEYTKTGKIRKKTLIGRFGGGKKLLSEVIDVALFQSLSNRDDLSELFSKYGMVIVDEAHHIAAQSFEETIKFANSAYLYGLTATPERKDGLTPLLFMRLGEIIYENHLEAEDSLLIPQYFYPRFTNYGEFNSVTTYHEHLHQLTKDSHRNQLIIRDIVENIRDARSSLVLTERLEHVDCLYALLKNELKDVNIYRLKSQQSKKENQQLIEEMNQLKEPFVVIATGKFVGEGFDLHQLEAIFFCLPFSWKGSTQQYLGRLQRNVADKRELRIYDYIDASVNMLTKMYYKRQREYIKLGYQLAEDEQTHRNQTQLYNGKNYLSTLLKDSQQTTHIYLSVTHFSQALVNQLESLSLKGKTITVICRHPIKPNGLSHLKAQAYIKRLKELKIQCILVQINPQPFVVLDDGLIWYGDLRFYTTNDVNKNSIRLINQELASKLLGQYI